MDWSTLRTELAFAAYSNILVRLSRFNKIVLIIGGAAAATVALAIDIAHANKEVSAWTIIGLVGAGLVALGSIFDVLKEGDASRALIVASGALDAVHQRELQLNEMLNDGEYDKAVTRGLHLYTSMDVMRGAIEQSLDLPDIPATTIIQTCLSAASNSLLGAFDFGITDIWTICVYMALPDRESGKIVLRCIAHHRKIPCELSNARVWPEGVGVTGMAYSINQEIIIKDMSSPDVSPLFDLRAMGREYDKLRYASIVAVPIVIGNAPRPWGVAVATSDQPDHFSPEPSTYGVATTEAARAIAAMSALAAKAAETSGRRAADVAPAIR